MKTITMPGVAARADDDEICATLKACTTDEGTGHAIGIRNESGQIYRKVSATSDELTAVHAALVHLGLTDEVQLPPVEGFHAIFR